MLTVSRVGTSTPEEKGNFLLLALTMAGGCGWSNRVESLWITQLSRRRVFLVGWALIKVTLLQWIQDWECPVVQQDAYAHECQLHGALAAWDLSVSFPPFFILFFQSPPSCALLGLPTPLQFPVLNYLSGISRMDFVFSVGLLLYHLGERKDPRK